MPLKLFSVLFIILCFYVISGFSGCKNKVGEKSEPKVVWDSLEVTASAYNSLSWQTGPGNPTITAWGDTLKSDMKVIAVSRDLIEKGFDHNTPVKIEGFEGEFLVKDKMHYRWKNKIDIYMGDNVEKAKEWGRRKVKIYFKRKTEDSVK